jgi:hypothetical protein
MERIIALDKKAGCHAGFFIGVAAFTLQRIP